jgi:TatD DNase family protein
MNSLNDGGNTRLNHPAIFHAYEGNAEDAYTLIKYGCLFGVGGPITYKNAKQKIEVFTNLPDDSILLETDAPYLPPTRHRGERNEPSYLPAIINKLAELRHQNPEDLTNLIFENSYKMVNEEHIH